MSGGQKRVWEVSQGGQWLALAGKARAIGSHGGFEAGENDKTGVG